MFVKIVLQANEFSIFHSDNSIENISQRIKSTKDLFTALDSVRGTDG